MMRNFDEDILPSESQAISSALAAVIHVLSALGPEGAQCVQALIQAETSFKAEGQIAAKREVFRSFHLGFVRRQELGPSNPTPLPDWSWNEGLKLAYETGGQAAYLNHLQRRGGLLRRKRLGPFDEKAVLEAFAHAMQAVATSGKRMADNR